MARSVAREKRRKTLQFQWERLHKARRNSVYRRVRRMLDDITRTILWRAEVRGTPKPDSRDLFHAGELYEPGRRVMVPQWRALISSGIKFEFDWIHEAEESKTQKLQIRELFSPSYQIQETLTEEPPPSIYVDLTPSMRRDVDTWIASRQVGFWTKLEEKVIRPLIEKVIAESISNGLTLPEFRKRLQEEMTHLSKVAAERIARTETTSAMNYGGQLERAELDIEFKSWIATIDIRTRTLINSGYDHMAANGQVVENGSQFVVSGEKLMFPGDGTHGATAGNVINCRCAAAAEFDFDAHKKKPAPSVPAATLTDPPAAITTPLVPGTTPVVPPPPAPTGPLKRVFADFEHERDHPDTKTRVDYYQARAAHFEKEHEAIRVQVMKVRSEAGEMRLKVVEAEKDVVAATRAYLQSRNMEQIEFNEKILEEANRKLAEAKATFDRERMRVFGEIMPHLLQPEDQRSEVKNLAGGARMKADRKRMVTETIGELQQIVSRKNLNPPETSITVDIRNSTRRSGYDTSTKIINLHYDRGNEVVAHEVMHGFEHQGTKANENASRGFLFSRIGSLKPEKMRVLWPDHNYDPWEKGFRGAFTLPDLHASDYASKLYRTTTCNEIVTSGVEWLYTDAVGFAVSDPGYFRFIIGWLRGDFS